MASKRHPHAPRLVQWLRLLVLAALVVHFGQCWAPTSSLLRVQPRRRRDGSSSSRTSCSSVETISKFNRVVLSAETEDVEETRRVQAEIRESFKTSADSLASSPDLEVPEGFVLHPGGGAPAADELTNENMLRIILSMCTDAEVNELVWKCLGYRRKDGEGEWDASECFPKWKERFPTPPDLIGVTRIYSKEIDGPSLKANQALVRTVPMKYKQSIREHLRPEGFNGFKLAELTPNKTRRAQCANWLLYYREALFGVSLEELQRRKAEDVEAENFKLRMEGKSAKLAGPDVRKK